MGPRSGERGNKSESGRCPRIEVPSMGPRSGERGNLLEPLIHKLKNLALQWGRAQVSAEIQYERGTPSCTAILQWGRAQVSAEILRLVRNDHCFSVLQWGRAQVSAEIVLDPIGPPEGEVLQWGRAQVSAEIRTSIRARFRNHVPSMGPRSGERGNS